MRIGLLGFGIAALMALWDAWLEHERLAPDGGGGEELPQMLLAVPLMFVLLGVPLPALLLSFARRSRVVAACLAVFWLGTIAGWLAVNPIYQMQFRQGFERVSARSKPLIDAIERYSSEHGSPPDSLDLLVPQYLRAIPSTGIGAYPDFKYRIIPPKKRGDTPSPWELSVPCGSGLNWDVFFYWPGQQYPRETYDGTVERIAGWAYVHE